MARKKVARKKKVANADATTIAKSVKWKPHELQKVEQYFEQAGVGFSAGVRMMCFFGIKKNALKDLCE